MAIRGVLELSEGRPDTLSKCAQGLLLGKFLPVAKSPGTFFTGPPPLIYTGCSLWHTAIPWDWRILFPFPFPPQIAAERTKGFALLLGQGVQERPFPPAAMSHGFLITQRSGQLSPGSLQPDVWANYPQHCSETHWEWLWTYDPNYFWFPAWMILSASGLSLSNLQHSKFPHAVLK